LGYALAFPDDEVMLAVFVISKLAIAAALLYVALMLRKLKIAGKRLADGELDHKIALDGLFLDFREHAVDLNRIGDGMNAAVEQRTKSERMKAELITNVSHDLKTPLTSIINYSDLICRERSENEKINEYAEVLHRQSVRMKRLIEDLVEVSKLSSRNVEVELCECDAAIFVEQLMGEYSQRLSSLSLEAKVSVPAEKLKIMADSKKLWRVFDNLMSNICKYAQGGTRVYVSLEDDGGCAKFIFKNISREPIGVSCEELSERFVRGDASRSTDGNGLGLSIAKNLCELQGGKLDVSVDGDLFKVIVYLPRV
jgi:signal transduction histidine kinase